MSLLVYIIDIAVIVMYWLTIPALGLICGLIYLLTVGCALPSLFNKEDDMDRRLKRLKEEQVANDKYYQQLEARKKRGT
ncbi:MAG: hypothetical protein ACRCZ2_12425 [Fusobacteriaceae bacterium]